MRPFMRFGICFRCGYCCRHYDIREAPESIIKQAQRFGVPLKGPCDHLVDLGDKTACEIYYQERPSFCVAGPDFTNTLNKLEERLEEGNEDFPACMKYLMTLQRDKKLKLDLES